MDVDTGARASRGVCLTVAHLAGIQSIQKSGALSAKVIRAQDLFAGHRVDGLQTLGDTVGQLGGKLTVGDEPGSVAYADGSLQYLVKTEAVSSSRLTVSPLSPGLQSLHPFGFKAQDLENGDILVAKDGPVGSVSVLFWDAPPTNVMLSSGIVRIRLPAREWFYYGVLRFGSFSEGIDLLTPRQATYRHAGLGLIRDALVPLPLPFGEPQRRMAGLAKLCAACEQTMATKLRSVVSLLDVLVGTSDASVVGLPTTVTTSSAVGSARRLDAAYLAAKSSEFSRLVARCAHSSFADAFAKGEIRESRGQNLQFTSIGFSDKHDSHLPGDWRLLEPNYIQPDFGIPRYRWLWCPRLLKVLKDGQVLVSAEGTIGNVTIFREEPDYPTVSNIHCIILDSALPDREMHNAWIAANIAYLREKGWLRAISVGGQGGSLALRYWRELPLLDFDPAVGEEVLQCLAGGPMVPTSEQLADMDADQLDALVADAGAYSARELDVLRFRASEVGRQGVGLMYPE